MLYHWLGEEAEAPEPSWDWKRLGNYRLTITEPAKWMEVVNLAKLQPWLLDGVDVLFDPQPQESEGWGG